MVTQQSHLGINYVNSVAVVTFLDKNIRWEGKGDLVNAVSTELIAIANDEQNILLDFQGVTYFDESMIGKLVTFWQKMRKKCKIVMCNVEGFLLESMLVKRLDLLFGFQAGRTQEQALRLFD